jgi:hypothetical protein
MAGSTNAPIVVNTTEIVNTTQIIYGTSIISIINGTVQGTTGQPPMMTTGGMITDAPTGPPPLKTTTASSGES